MPTVLSNMEPISMSEKHTDEAHETRRVSSLWRNYTCGIREHHILLVVMIIFAAWAFWMVCGYTSWGAADCGVQCDNANVSSTSSVTTYATDRGVIAAETAVLPLLPAAPSLLSKAKAIHRRAHLTTPALSTTIVISGSTVVVTLPGIVFVPPFDTTTGTPTTDVPAHTTPRVPPKATTTAKDTTGTSKITDKGTHTTGSTSVGTTTTGSAGSAPTTATGDGFDSTVTLELTTTIRNTETGIAPTETTTSSAATTAGMQMAYIALTVAMVVSLAVTCF